MNKTPFKVVVPGSDESKPTSIPRTLSFLNACGVGPDERGTIVASKEFPGHHVWLTQIGAEKVKNAGGLRY